MDNLGEFVLAILGSSLFGAVVTFLLTRRKYNAETASEEVDSTSKAADLIAKMQSENVDLYKKNTDLEKINIDQARTIEILSTRLASRDSELASTTRQLDLLRNLAAQAPITEALRNQLDTMNTIIANLQAAQSDASKMLKEKENAFQELLKTNRDLVLQKPAKKEQS